MISKVPTLRYQNLKDKNPVNMKYIERCSQHFCRRSDLRSVVTLKLSYTKRKSIYHNLSV